jgi:ubiquinone/menaquinone biosynthesis C-methylase UbiE
MEGSLTAPDASGLLSLLGQMWNRGALGREPRPVDPSRSLTLADSSDGMLRAARVSLGNRVEYVLADVGALPFPDATFDVVVANHMLYHMPDRPRAFAEIQRVLAPAGAFHCSTNGRGHLG